MRVLDPAHQRSAFTDALRPPAGYVLGAGIGTTYSLDFEAFTAVVLAFVGADFDDPVHDSPAALTAIARLRSRLRVFMNAGSLCPPSAPNRLFGLYDRVLRPVALDGTAFHPKIWALRFDPVSRPERHTAQPIYRVLCASRNVADSGCWELGVAVNGVIGSRKQQFGAEVAAFCRRVAAAGDLPKGLWKLMAELPLVEFERNSESERELRLDWQWPGQKALAACLPKRARRGLLISPFIRADFVRTICDRVDKLIVVSTQHELDALPEDAHKRLDRARTFVVTATDLDDMPGLELHAKLLAWESDGESQTLLGSANATGAAWGLRGCANCEAVVSLRPGLGVDNIVRAFVSPSKGQLHGWIEEYCRRTQEPDDEEEATKHLERLQRTLSSDRIRGTFDGSARLLVLCSTTARPRQPVPEYVRADIVPLLQRDTNAWKDYANIYGDGARFTNIALEDLSAFALVRLRDKRYECVELRFGIQFELALTEQEGDARDDAINARLLEGVDPRALLLNVLRGLPAGAWMSPSTNGTAAGGAGRSSLLQRATIERIVEVCTSDPSRIQEIEAVLRASRGSEDMATFREFWKVFQDALQEERERG